MCVCVCILLCLSSDKNKIELVAKSWVVTETWLVFKKMYIKKKKKEVKT